VAVFDREHYFRDLLAKQVGGKTEVTLPFGRADVMTDTTVWEVEPASRYPAGVRQALQYGSQTGLTAALATYGPRELVTKVFGHLAKLPAPGVELWWLCERRFVPIRSAGEAKAAARNIPPQYRWAETPPALSSSLPCEVTWQEGEVTHSCESEPVVWVPVRLCREHRLQLFPEGPPIPSPLEPLVDVLNDHGLWTGSHDLKTATDLTFALERLAWPHLNPGDRALISIYLIEVRSAIWNSALGQPDYAKVWGDDSGAGDAEGAGND